MANSTKTQNPTAASGNNYHQADFLEVLLALSDKTKRETKVSSLGVIKNVDVDNSMADVMMFPLQEGKTDAILQTVKFFSSDLKKACLNDSGEYDGKQRMCLVLYTDQYSLSNFNAIMKNKTAKAYSVTDALHGVNNGFVIAVGDAIEGE